MRDFGLTQFWRLLFVATCAMGAEFLLALADTIVAGHLIGETALAGINLLQPVFSLVQFIAVLVGMGTAIRYSLETGRFARRRADEMFSQGFWSALILSAVLLLLFVFGREAFLGFFGASAEATEYARRYWVWYAPCAFLLPMTLFFMSVVYADGGVVACAFGYVSLIGGNVVASWFLCRQMGIAGCALGTVIGNLFAIFSLVAHFLSKANTLRVVRHFAFRDFRLICRSSFAADASVMLAWALLFFLLAKLVVAEFGSAMLPVLSVVLVLINLKQLFNGVASAAQPIVGVYVGERNERGIGVVMRAAIGTAFVEGAALALFFALVPEAAVKMVGIEEVALVPEAVRAVRIVSIGFIGSAFVFLFNFYYLFIERYALALALTYVAEFFSYALLSLPLAHLFGMTGLLWSLGVAPILAVGVFALVLLARYGRKRFPLLLSSERARHQAALGFCLDDRGLGAAVRFAESRRSGSGALVGEVFTRVRAANGRRRVRGEVSFDFNDGVSLCLRDDGKVFDPTKGLSVSGTHFLTMGYNRNLFKL